MPHCLDPHTLETLGPENLNGHLSLGSFAAHYRIDPDNQVFQIGFLGGKDGKYPKNLFLLRCFIQNTVQQLQEHLGPVPQSPISLIVD